MRVSICVRTSSNLCSRGNVAYVQQQQQQQLVLRQGLRQRMMLHSWHEPGLDFMWYACA
jgi:hypothetical protein